MLIPLLLSYLLLIASARAQVSAPTNCTDSLVWSLNSLLQSPCIVAAYLAAVCNNGAFTIPALLPQNSYTGPSGPDDSDQCKCNTVLYNLISACDACQGQSWIPYSMWSANCTNKATPGIFPEPVPDGTRVPQWAYIDTSVAGTWNNSAAQATGDSPEVTGTSLIVPTSTSRASQSTTTPSASGVSSPASTSQSSSNAGAIAGGVVGGIIGVALITGAVAWFVVHRRRARSSPSDRSGQRGEKGQKLPLAYPPTVETPRLYDPSDPSTYPSQEYLPVSVQRLDSGSTRHTQPNNAGYSGLPEI